MLAMAVFLIVAPVIPETANAQAQSFKERVAEGKDDAEVNRYYNGFGPYHYAASTHSLQVFKERVAEGKNDAEVNRYYNGFGPYHYAASTHSLQVFKERVAEGKNDAEVNRYYNGFGPYHYAASTHSLQVFKERVAEGKNDAEVNRYYNGFGPYHYAASTHSLQVFKERVAEGKNDAEVNRYYNGFGPYYYAASTHSLGMVASLAAPTDTQVKVVVNGTTLSFDQPPIIQDGRTLVPLRVIFEALGANVDWEQSTQTVTAVRGNVTVSLAIGSSILTRNGEQITLDVPAQLINGRTFVPARAVAESFGAQVGWDAATRTVTIAE